MAQGNPNPTYKFPPGVSGNPGGRPKKEWTWAGLLEAVGEEIETKSGQKFKDLVSRRLWVDAVNGSLGAQKEIMNRMEGMPKQPTEHSADQTLQEVLVRFLNDKPDNNQHSK